MAEVMTQRAAVRRPSTSRVKTRSRAQVRGLMRARAVVRLATLVFKLVPEMERPGPQNRKVRPQSRDQ